MPAGRPYAYDVDTAVEAVADRPGETGRFAAVITDRWNVLGGRPNGGYVLGVALRALARVMPAPDPLAVSAFFLRPTLPGPVEVATETVGAGSRIATGGARVIQDGKETLRVTAAFADLAVAVGRTVTLVEQPSLPRPRDSIDLLSRGAIAGLTIAARVEYRVAAMPGPAPGWRSGTRPARSSPSRASSRCCPEPAPVGAPPPPGSPML